MTFCGSTAHFYHLMKNWIFLLKVMESEIHSSVAN